MNCSAFYSEARSDMTSNSRAPLVIPILIIVVGVGWLLTAQGIGPGINWVWTLGLGVIGILVFVVSKGFDKVSVVIGPFFLFASLLSVLRQTGQLSLDIEVPMLVISIGALLLVAQLPAVPNPRWFVPFPSPTEESSAPKKLRVDDAPGKPSADLAEGRSGPAAGV
jgi:hypothetical protein